MSETIKSELKVIKCEKLSLKGRYFRIRKARS